MNFKQFIDFLINSFLYPLTNIILSAAIVFFLWNIMQVIRKSDDPKELEKFKTKAVWGIVAIAVMVSMWGLVNFITKSARLDNSPIVIPTLNN